MQNYLLDRRQGTDRWSSYSSFKLYRDGNGNLFPNGSPRYVIFDGELLVGEFVNETEGNRAFLEGKTLPDGVRRSDYKGIEKGLL